MPRESPLRAMAGTLAVLMVALLVTPASSRRLVQLENTVISCAHMHPACTSCSVSRIPEQGSIERCAACTPGHVLTSDARSCGKTNVTHLVGRWQCCPVLTHAELCAELPPCHSIHLARPQPVRLDMLYHRELLRPTRRVSHVGVEAPVLAGLPHARHVASCSRPTRTPPSHLRTA